MRLTSPKISKRTYLPLSKQFASKSAPKSRKVQFTCIGGPFDSQKVSLEVSGEHVQTAEFGVQSYNNGERGRYFRVDKSKLVEWRTI